MKVFIDRIGLTNYELAMDIIKGLEHGPFAGKYECVFRPSSDDVTRRGGGVHEIEVYALETPDKTPIGFADEEETK